MGTASMAVRDAAMQDKARTQASCPEVHSAAHWWGLLSSAPQHAQFCCAFTKVQVVLSILAKLTDVSEQQKCQRNQCVTLSVLKVDFL